MSSTTSKPPPLDTAPDSLVGRVIDGKYDVQALIGRGGMGTVYRVRDWEENVDLAVKAPLSHLVSDRINRERFILEAQTWIDLGVHPNIVQCWFVREHEGLPLLFLDYLPLGSLKDYRRAGHLRPNDWEAILDLMIQACAGLAYAHENGLVHRDVKPANFLMAEHDRLCVTDFGLVKITQLTPGQEPGDGERAPWVLPDESLYDEWRAEEESLLSSLTLTGTGTLLGTPEYGAPEQWAEARRVGPPADVYALGVILYELSAGRRPFDDGIHRVPAPLLVGRHMSKDPPPPSQFNEDLPASISDLALRCLAKSPEDRPGSMLSLREELERIHRDVCGKPYPRPRPRAGTQRADALNNKAVSLWSLGFGQRAFDAWREASKLDALHPETVYNRSMLQLRQGQINEAETLRRLTQVKAANPHLGAYLGYFHLDRCAPEEAARELSEALQFPLAARNGTVWRALGDARMYLEDYLAAAEAYWRALELMPQDREAQSRLLMARKGVRRQHGAIRFPLGTSRLVVQGSGPVTAVGISPDRSCVVHATADGLECWELLSGQRLWQWLDEARTYPVAKLAVLDEWVLSLDSPRGRVWSLKTGQILCELEGRRRFLAVVPGQNAALAGGETLEWVELPSGLTTRRMEGHSKSISCASVSPDGRLAVTGSGDRSVRLWDLDNASCLRVLEGHTDMVESVVLVIEHTIALSGGRDRTVRVWHLATGECLLVLEHEDVVRRLRMTADGRTVAVSSWTLGEKDSLDVWDVTGGARLLRRAGGHSLALLRGGPWMLVASRAARPGQLSLCELPGGRLLRTFDGHAAEVTCLAVSRDERWAVSGSADGSLRVWEVDWASRIGAPALVVNRMTDHREVESTQQRFLASYQQALQQCDQGEFGDACRTLVEARQLPGYIRDPRALALNGELLGRLARQGVRAVWQPRSCASSGAVAALALSPDGSHGLSAAGKVVYLWELSSGSCLRGFTGHTDAVKALCLSRDGRLGLSGGLDGTLRLWNLGSGDCVRDFRVGEPVLGLQMSDDGAMATAVSAGRLFLWDLQGSLICKLDLRGLGVAALKPDGRLLFTAGDTLRVFSLPDGREVLRGFRTPKGHEHWLGDLTACALAVTADGAYGLSAGFDHSLRLWSLEDGHCQSCWAAHDDHISALALTADGRAAVSASQDGTIKIWDVATTRLMETIHADTVGGLKMSPDGRFLLTGGADAQLRTWELDWELNPDVPAASLGELWRKSGLLGRLTSLLRRKR